MPTNIKNHISRLKDNRETLKSRQELEQKVRFIQRKLVRLSFSPDNKSELYQSLLRSLHQARSSLSNRDIA